MWICRVLSGNKIEIEFEIEIEIEIEGNVNSIFRQIS